MIMQRIEKKANHLDDFGSFLVFPQLSRVQLPVILSLLAQ